MKRSDTLRAREVLARAGIAPGQDFFTLSASQISELLEEADRMKYRKPRNANGSRGRYFYAYLVRRARGTVVDIQENLKQAIEKGGAS
jgi:hypothetical protein